jgi:hypothetical protein
LTSSCALWIFSNVCNNKKISSIHLTSLNCKLSCFHNKNENKVGNVFKLKEKFVFCFSGNSSVIVRERPEVDISLLEASQQEVSLPAVDHQDSSNLDVSETEIDLTDLSPSDVSDVNRPQEDFREAPNSEFARPETDLQEVARPEIHLQESSNPVTRKLCKSNKPKTMREASAKVIFILLFYFYVEFFKLKSLLIG